MLRHNTTFQFLETDDDMTWDWSESVPVTPQPPPRLIDNGAGPSSAAADDPSAADEDGPPSSRTRSKFKK